MTMRAEVTDIQRVTWTAFVILVMFIVEVNIRININVFCFKKEKFQTKIAVFFR